MATFVATSAAVATFGWRIAERMRLENREAHDRIGARIDEVEEKLGGRIDGVEERLGVRIDEVEERLGARIDKVEGGLGDVREGLGEIRGELRGTTRSPEMLRKDFRAHAFANAD
ncbi:MAG: hypothetical protein OXI76_13295 [Gemmatimonadota bacterium]|nr:hypothetical protein [Gemmatimonadota bacterium]